jgi:hypothetical protein
MRVIGEVFDVTPREFAAVKEVDRRMFATEMRAPFRGGLLVAPGAEPFDDVDIVCFEPSEAETVFLCCFHELYSSPVSKEQPVSQGA